MNDVIIIGGSADRLKDFWSVYNKTDPQVIITVNHYPPPEGIGPNYICYLDDIEQLHKGKKHHIKIARENLHRKHGTRAVSIRSWQCDITITDHKERNIGDSGILAVHFALIAYTGRIYLCGFDLRRNANPNKTTDTIKKWKEYFLTLSTDQVRRMQPMSPEMFGFIADIPSN